MRPNINPATAVSSVTIAKIEIWAFREPVEIPVLTSFGVMRDRPAVFIRIEDTDGCFGFGEVFANWPAAGAEHRVKLLEKDIAHLALNLTIAAPEDLGKILTSKLRIAMIQTREFGPFQQVIAGLDIACWDLFARKAELPVAQLYRRDANVMVPTYASGIHVDAAPQEIARARDLGFNRFKVKVGFDQSPEVEKVTQLVDGLAAEELLMIDVNQGWRPSQAKEFIHFANDLPLGWIEEPLPVDSATEVWKSLASISNTPLAGGENIAGYMDYSKVISDGYLGVLQPDIIKWGGITGCGHIATVAIMNGQRYCPHYLGGGIGLSASAHLLSAIGGDGWLEVDVNPNRLRTSFQGSLSSETSGSISLVDEPGLGIESLPDDILPFLTAYHCCT